MLGVMVTGASNRLPRAVNRRRSLFHSYDPNQVGQD